MPSTPPALPNQRRRSAVALRLATIPAGYALASLIVACVVRFAPVSRVEAVSIGFLSFFGVYAALLIWAFATTRPARMWAIWIVSAVVLGIAVAWSIAQDGRA